MTTPDETAASYGLFQVAYASLDQGITNSLVAFLRAKDEMLAFDLIASIPFRVRLEKLDALAKTLNQESEYAQHIRAALSLAKQVSQWRNARVHPRVEFLDGIRPVLIGKKDGKPLEIDVATCWERFGRSALRYRNLTHTPTGL
jgi:hypothetical protein